MSLPTGIIPALITPFAPNGTLLTDSIAPMVERLISEGVGGLYLCGSTAECHLMSLDERKSVAAHAIAAVDGRIPVIVHVGTIGTDMAMDLARHASDQGADLVSAVPPFYYRFSADEIREYYFDIADAAKLPMIVYNFPALTGVSIDVEHGTDILTDNRIAGVKHTSTDLYQLQQMKTEIEGLSVYNGFDENILGGLAMGADGAIGSTFNFMAPRFIKLIRAFNQGDIAEAQRLQSEANRIISVLREVGVYPGIKHILNKRGDAVGECRRPFSPLEREQRRRIDEVLDGVS